MAWLTGWNRRRSKIINGTTAGIQTDYQLKLIVHKGAGTDTSTDIYLGNSVRDDFGDVRFTSSDETTLLNYWIESYTSGSFAIFWIKIPSVPAYPGTATIYIYYDNLGQTTTSNGTNTFVLFDDFSTNTWSGDNTYLNVSGNKVNFGTSLLGNLDVYKYKNFTKTTDLSVYYSVRVTQGQYRGGVGVGFGGSAGRLRFISNSTHSRTTQDIAHLAERVTGGVASSSLASEPVNSPQRWYRTIYSGSNVTLYVYSNIQKTSQISGSPVSVSGAPTSGLNYILISNTADNVNNNFPGNGSFISSLFITKYTSPEPLFGASGSEEFTTVGNLNIDSCPHGASIYIDEILQPGVTTPAYLVGLSQGSHTYRLTLNNYNDATGTFTITGGQDTFLVIVLSRIASYLTNWNRRKQINISGTTAGTQSNYQMRLTVYKGSGTDSPGIIYCNNNVRDDFGDIRFTTSDGSTLLNYYIESYVSGNYAIIWVKVDSILASPCTSNIFIYYNNPSATTTSNAPNTFDLFDDFTTNTGWTTVGSAAISGGTANMAVNGNSESYLYKSLVPSSNWIIEFITRASNWVYAGGMAAGLASNISRIDPITGSTTSTQTSAISADISQYGSKLTYEVNNTFSQSSYISLSLNTNYYYKLVKNGSTVTLYIFSNAGRTTQISGSPISITGISLSTSYFIISNSKRPGDNYISAWLDNLSVRKYVSPEPTFASSGTEEQPTGSLNITSTPIGARVSIDGIDQGTFTPTLTDLTVGTHSLKLTYTNYNDYNTIVNIVSGQTTNVSPILTLSPGTTKIEVSPSFLRPPAYPGEMIDLGTITMYWDGTGTIILERTIVYDRLLITGPNGTFDRTWPAYCGAPLEAQGPFDITNIFTIGNNQINIKIYDICGVNIGTTGGSIDITGPVILSCPTSPKYSGDTVTLQATPKDGIGPYNVTFKKGIDTIVASRLTDELGNPTTNPISGAPENTLITRVYTLDDADIASSDGTIDFSVIMSDSCPTGAKFCTEICTVNLGCIAPVCNFTVI